jgi:hypothetical protein
MVLQGFLLRFRTGTPKIAPVPLRKHHRFIPATKERKEGQQYRVNQILLSVSPYWGTLTDNETAIFITHTWLYPFAYRVTPILPQKPTTILDITK